MKMLSWKYRNHHCGNKTTLRTFHLHNGICSTDKAILLYWIRAQIPSKYTLYPIEFAPSFVMLCFVVVMTFALGDACDEITHILQWYFTGSGAIVCLPIAPVPVYLDLKVYLILIRFNKSRIVCIILGTCSINYWGPDKMAAILQTIFAFSWTKRINHE